MIESFFLLATALWLGIVTSISPCPLATNVAALSYLSRKANDRTYALVGALCYSSGRVAAYGGVALVIFLGGASMPEVSAFLRDGIKPFLGPFLILAGMALTGLLPVAIHLNPGDEKTIKRIATWGHLGEFLIGIIFALSFCPVSAGLFFGSLIPVAISSKHPASLFVAYGLGTALPVALVAVFIAISLERASKFVARIQTMQKTLTFSTGGILIALGLYLTAEGMFF